MSSLSPLELATCLEIKELVNDSLRKDLRLAQTSHMDALKELDPQQQEAEMGLTSSSSSTINSSTSSLSSSSITTTQPRILSDDILRMKASTARQEAIVCVENAPEMVETSITSQKVASFAEELYNELRRRARFEASSLEHYSDELKLLTPSLERVITETQAVLNNVDKSLMKISSSFALVSSTAAELNENEDLVKKEEELLDMWESSLGVCTPLLIENGSNTSVIDNSSNTSQIDLVPTPKRSHPPSLPHQLLDQIAFAEDDERKVVANSYNRKLTDMRSDIEARIRVIKNGEIERIETTAKEVENELASSFDAQMALITAREKAAEKAATELSTRLTYISSELVSIRTLKRLRGQVRRMWAVSQPDRLCLALDCDSEGWKDDEEDEDEEDSNVSVDFENIRAFEADSLKIKHTREIADANATVQLRKNERSAAMAALAEATLRIETEARKLRRARVSPLLSLGLFTGAISDAEMKSEDKSVMNSSHTVRIIDSLPKFTIDQSSSFDAENRDGYHVNESLPSALLNEKRAIYKELENSSAVKTAKMAKAALALAEKKFVEAEQISQYLRIRQERRAAALMLKRAQRHQRAAAALLAKGVIEAELENVIVGKEGRDTKIAENSTPSSSTLLSHPSRKSERVDLLKWRESVRKLTHEQRMRNAICRFLTKAVRAVPYDPDYAVVLTVAQKVGQRILKRIESSKGEVTSIPSKSPLLNDSRFGNSSSLSLLGVIDRIVKSAKESNERKVFGGVGMDNLAKRLSNGESDDGKAQERLEGESLCEDKTSASKIASQVAARANSSLVREMIEAQRID
jgi:hypothetical protein